MGVLTGSIPTEEFFNSLQFLPILGQAKDRAGGAPTCQRRSHSAVPEKSAPILSNQEFG